jgi:hypothetical protein
MFLTQTIIRAVPNKIDGKGVFQSIEFGTLIVNHPQILLLGTTLCEM